MGARMPHPALSTSIVCTRPYRLAMLSPSEERAAFAAGMRTKITWDGSSERGGGRM